MDTLLLVLGLTVAAVYVPPLVLRFAQTQALRRRATGRLVLTYDDGPDDEFTLELARELKQLDARATFYFVGQRTAGRFAVCDEVVLAGHEVCPHGDRHLNDWRRPWRGPTEARSAYVSLARWTHPRASYRPPFGKLATPTWLALITRGRSVVWWTLVSGDTYPELPPLEQVVDSFLEAGGGVVLLHSHHRSPERRRFVQALTRRLIEAARSRDFEICTYRELQHASGRGKPLRLPRP